MNRNASKFQAKDPVPIGSFTALCMALCVIFEILGGLGPPAWVFMPAFLGFLCGLICITLANKVQPPGVPLPMGLIRSAASAQYLRPGLSYGECNFKGGD